MSTTPSRDTTEKLTISLPRTLADRFKAHIPPRQRSRFITEMLEERLAIKEQLQALEETAGCWSEERHPDMTTEDDIDSWLAKLRGGGNCRQNWLLEEDRHVK